MRRRVLVGALLAAGLIAAILLARPFSAAPPDAPHRPEGRADEKAPPAIDLPALEDGAGPAGAGFLVTGTVVHWRRHLVPGARVTLNLPDGRRERTVTDVAGRFEFPLRAPPPRDEYLAIHVVGPDGLAGTWTDTPNPVDEGVLDTGKIILWVSHRLEVRVVDTGGASVAGARVLLANEHAVLAEAVADEGGLARLPPVHRGRFEVIAVQGLERRGSRVIELPTRTEAPLEVVVGPTRTIEVRVMEKGTDLPIPGAVVRFERDSRKGSLLYGSYPALPPVAPTDETGTTWIRGTDPADLISVEEVMGPGHGGPFVFYFAYIRPDQTEVRIALPPPRDLRVPVVPGESPVPPDGAGIALAPLPGASDPLPPARGRMVGGLLLVPGATGDTFRAVATAPDGSIAVVIADEEPSETSFDPPRSLAVRVREPDGSPVAGLAFFLRDEGFPGAALTEIARTDETGVVRFDGLLGGKVDVAFLPHPASAYGVNPIETVDLSEGSRELEITVGKRREFALRLRAGGEPVLPSEYGLTVDGFAMCDAVEDPERGEIRFSWRPLWSERSIYVQFNAHPYFSINGWRKPPEGDEPAVFALDISRGGAVAVKIVPPADGDHAVIIQRRDESGGWATPEGHARPLEPGTDGTLELRPLPAGTYRLLDRRSGRRTAPFEVVEGDTPAEAALDLSATGWVTGTVVPPDGFAAWRALVHREGRGLAPGSGYVDTDGSFRVRVPGDRPVTLVPRHPLLRPAAEGSSVTLTDPRDGVVLKLETGTLAEIRVEARLRYQECRALLYHGDPLGEPVEIREIVLHPGTLRFGDYEPGSYTVFLDIEGYAPALLRDRTLGEGTTDLGTVRLERGSSLRVKLERAGEAASRYEIVATRKEIPTYERRVFCEGEDEVVVTGLGAGTFRVRLKIPHRDEAVRETTVTVDGRNDAKVVFDLR